MIPLRELKSRWYITTKSTSFYFVFILPNCFTEAKFNFAYSGIYQLFSIFCLYEPGPHFLFVSLKVSLVSTQSTHAQSLVKNYGMFSMFRMS